MDDPYTYRYRARQLVTQFLEATTPKRKGQEIHPDSGNRVIVRDRVNMLFKEGPALLEDLLSTYIIREDELFADLVHGWYNEDRKERGKDKRPFGRLPELVDFIEKGEVPVMPK